MGGRRLTETVRVTAIGIIEELRRGPATLVELVRKTKSSKKTVRRALAWLREAHAAPLGFVRRSGTWELRDAGFALPMLERTEDDYIAILTAAGLLDALGHTSARRVWAMLDELEADLKRKTRRRIERSALRVFQTAPIVQNAAWLPLVLRSTRERVLRIEYRSPWKNEVAVHTFEPWQVGIFEGSLYVCGHSHERGEARTLNFAQMITVSSIPNRRPKAAVPASPWGDRDPNFGMDQYEPGVARLRFKGAVARWLAGVRWQRDQKDAWIEPGEVLERTLSFRSRRELARRLMSVSAGLILVEPPELDLELSKFLEEARQAALARATPT